MSQPDADAAKMTAARWMWLKEVFPIVGMLALTIGAFYCCWLVVRPFFSVLAWTTAFTVSAMPLHKRIEKLVPYRNLAAGISVSLVLFVLLLPAVLLVPRLIDQAVAGLHAVQAQLGPGGLQDLLDRHPWIQSEWRWLAERIDLNGAIQRAAALLTAGASDLVRGSFASLIELTLVIFFLFFFLRDHSEAMRRVLIYLPLAPREADKVIAAITDTIYATIFGKLLMGIAQGFLGGLMFWWLGLTAASFWGMMITIMAFVPVVGASAVWLPASILLLIGGHWIKAVILLLWGGLLLGSIDGILYPMLVRKRVNLHTVPIFMSIVGGLIAFGAAGFFVGPMAMSVTLVLLKICNERGMVAAEAGKTD